MKKKWKLYVWISYINLFISTFTFGGGYVIIPMVKKIFVTQKKLLQESEFLDLAAIAQSSPGAIAVNLNVLVAKKLAGIPGIALGLIFSILPPLVILGIISTCYNAFAANPYVSAALTGMQACVAALIVDLAVDMYRTILKEKSRLLDALPVLSFLACAFTGINAAILLVSGSLLYCLALYITRRRERKVS